MDRREAFVNGEGISTIPEVGRSIMQITGKTRIWLVALLLSVALAISASPLLAVKFQANKGKFDLLVVIPGDEAENKALLTKIENEMKAASKYLYNATGKQHQFGRVTILIPQSWSNDPSYEDIKDETENAADIKCGSKINNGSYTSGGKIYLDPNDIMKPGTEGRVVVHEFGHAVYGLGDEYCFYVWKLVWAIPPWKQYQVFRDGENWIKCTNAVDFETNKVEASDNDYKVTVYNANGETASIMWFPWENSIVEFCGHSNHNTGVNSDQNQKHNFMSCTEWMEKGKYEYKASGGKIYVEETPTIRKVKASDLFRVCLVIDHSGSMAGSPLSSAKSAAMKLVWESEHDNYIGIVQFNHTAQIVSGLTKINLLTKAGLLLAISGISSDGNTSIGAGLQVAKTVVESNTDPGYRNVLIVLTDGEENTAPWIDDVAPAIIAAKIRVYGIALGYVGTTIQSLRSLCVATGGTCQTALDWTQIAQVYNQIHSDLNPNSVNLTNTLTNINAGETLKRNVVVDSSATSGVKFSIDSDAVANIDFTLTDPSGRTLTSTYPGYFAGSGYKIFEIAPSEIRTGTWVMTLKNNGGSKTVVTLSARANSALRVQATVAQQQVGFPNPIWIKAGADKNGVVMTGLKVQAAITTPLGTVKTFELHDDGVNGDFMPGDGSYEGFFYDYDANGEYSITVTFNNEDNNAVLGPEFTDPGPEGAVAANRAPLGENIQRQTNAPSVTVAGYTIGKKAAPGKVDSLTLESMKLLGTVIFNRTLVPTYLVVLQWAAPGSSGYVGKATSYEMRYGSSLLTEENFESAKMVSSVPVPTDAGTFQQVELMNLSVGATYYFAIRAVDEAGNAGPVSNSVLVRLPSLKKK